MFRSLKITVLLLFFFQVNSLFAQVKKKVSPLEGKVYVLEILKEGKKKPVTSEDILKFSNGKFKSAYFYNTEMDPGAYECSYEDSTAEQKVINFTAEMKDKVNGDIAIFIGTIKNDSIQGTAEIKNKKGKLRDSYIFAGAAKQKKAPGGAKK